MTNSYPKGIIEEILRRNFRVDDFLYYNSSKTLHGAPENCFNYRDYGAILETEELQDPYFIFGFKNLSLTLSGYKITSSPNYPVASHLKSWDISGSNDTINWEFIHHVENDSQLNGYLYTAVYHIPVKKGPFRFFMLNNVTTHYNKKILISTFDVYDTVISTILDFKWTLNHKTKVYIKISFFLFTLILGK